MIRLFRFFVPASTVTLVAIEAIAIMLLFGLSFYLWLPTDPVVYMLDDLGLVRVALVSFSFLAGIYFQNLYSEVHVRSRLLLIQQMVMVGGIAFLLQALLGAVNPDLCVPLRPMLVGSVMVIAVICAGRLVFSDYVIPRVTAEKLVLLGDSPLLDDIASYLGDHPQLGIRIAGHIRHFELAEKDAGDNATSPSLEEQLRPLQSKRIVVGMYPYLTYRQCNDLLEMRFLGYSVDEAAGTYAKLFNREGLGELGVSRLVFDKEFEPTTRTLLFQALRNWLIGAVGLLLLSPLMLIIAAVLRLSGPVLDRRVCCGRYGNPFTLYRFRIAPVGGADQLSFVGRILARTGLYAAPQLLNVLRGQLSLVGPRPQRPEIVAALTGYIPVYPHRFHVSPGMTGWAQIQDRRLPGLTDSIADLEYDLYYIKYISATMDIFLISQAIKNILIWGARP